VLTVLGAAAILAGVGLAVFGGGSDYARRQAGVDSAEARQALDLIRAVCADPAAAASSMAENASERARMSVAGFAKQMSEAADVELDRAEWFGQYLRVGVVARLPGGGTARNLIFLRREQGELRITGVDRL
jgi:hypothetical protein